MFKLTAGKAEQYHDIEQDETRLRVPFTVFDEKGKEVESKNESFAIDTPLEEIQATLERHRDVMEEDYTRYEANKERDAQLAAAQEVADSISNITI